MAYKLDKSYPLKKSITTVAIEEIEGCLDSLESLNVHEAIHDIRKRLKKLRALVRLVRDELGEDNYKSINIFFRDLGRELSDLRDLTAYMETVELLRSRYGDHIYVNFFNSIIREVKKERDELEAKLRAEGFFSNHLMEKLSYARKEMIKWPVESDSIRIILPSIERVYKRGRKAMNNAYDNPEKEIFHEWRKRVKYLWYQTLLLQETWPEMFETLEQEIHLLADYLGDDHDLMELNDKLKLDGFNLEDGNQKELVHALVQEYSEHLRENAKTKGELIYAEKPGRFTDRIGKYTETNWN